MVVRGKVVSTGVVGGTARSRIELEGTTAAEVKRMFLEEPPGNFFRGAADYARRATEDGGQSFFENPLGGPPVMYTHLRPTADGIAGSFDGLIHGEAPVRITQEGSKTIIEETGTAARPNLGALPPQALLESIPLFGRVARTMRRATENAIGTGLAAVHASIVGADGARTIVDTLNRRQHERR